MYVPPSAKETACSAATGSCATSDSRSSFRIPVMLKNSSAAPSAIAPIPAAASPSIADFSTTILVGHDREFGSELRCVIPSAARNLARSLATARDDTATRRHVTSLSVELRISLVELDRGIRYPLLSIVMSNAVAAWSED